MREKFKDFQGCVQEPRLKLKIWAEPNVRRPAP